MNTIVEDFIISEAEKCFEGLLLLIPSTRHSEAKKLFFDSKTKINSVFCDRKIFLRHKTGQVSEFKNVYDAAKSIDYNVVTLENYLRKGKGYFEFSGYTISIVPIKELDIVEEGFWFRDSNGKVQRCDTVEKLAKVSGLKVESLRLYLRKGGGFAQTKRGHVSNKPMEDLSFSDTYRLTYFNKHGRWPDINEIPHDPSDNRHY